MKYLLKNPKPIFVTFMLLIILINVGTAIVSAKEKYLSWDANQRYDKLKFAYEDSQYANKHAKSLIPDETVNTYAGMAYVRGVNPILIAADTPPLGRYLIGFSTVIFNNENVITLVAIAVSLAFLYLLGTQIFPSRIIALLPPMLLSFEPLFKNQLVYTPLLDLIQLMFLLPYFYFFNQILGKKKHYLWHFIFINILLGCFITTKFYASGITILVATFIVLLLLRDKQKIITYALTVPLAIFVLLTTYIRSFIAEPNINHFLGIQKYIYVYHHSQLILPFSIWPLLYLNKWYVWFGNKPVISDNQWTLMWPIITTITLITIIAYFLRKIQLQKEIEIIMIWCVVYLFFFSIGQITSRYLVILLPCLYLISVWGIYALLSKKLGKKRTYENCY